MRACGWCPMVSGRYGGESRWARISERGIPNSLVMGLRARGDLLVASREAGVCAAKERSGWGEETHAVRGMGKESLDFLL